MPRKQREGLVSDFSDLEEGDEIIIEQRSSGIRRRVRIRGIQDGVIACTRETNPPVYFGIPIKRETFNFYYV